MSDPTPDLFDLCVVLNEATDAPLGADLLPYAARCKAIVIEALAEEAGPNPMVMFHNPYMTLQDWLRQFLPTSDTEAGRE